MIDFTLMKHQENIVHVASFEPNLFLAWSPGTGKTCATLQIIRAKCQDAGKLLKVLVLAPKVVLRNWKDELGMYTNIHANNVHILEGPVKKRAEFFTKHEGFSCVAITNYDAFQNEELVKAVTKWKPDILVCDESHQLKSPTSVRSKNVARIADICKHKYLLTGTPILNNALDLFQQYRILDGHLSSGSTFGHNFFAFRAMYFWDRNSTWKAKKGYFPEWVPRQGSEKALTDKIARKTSRVSKSECLDLPPLVVQNLYVDLGVEQKRIYSDMKKYFISYLESGAAVTAEMAVTKALRLQQIVSGFTKDDTKAISRFKDNPRVVALKDQLEMLTPKHKVIVWACFKENYAMIREVCADLGVKSVEVHGEVSQKDRDEAIEAFNNDPETRVYIGNQGAGGIGINLISATYAIYYSRGFKLGDDIQSEARNYRRGSEIHEKITRINIIANNTIDNLIADALQLKIDLSSNLLKIIKEKGHEHGF